MLIIKVSKNCSNILISLFSVAYLLEIILCLGTLSILIRHCCRSSMLRTNRLPHDWPRTFGARRCANKVWNFYSADRASVFVEFTKRAIDLWRKYLHSLEPVEKVSPVHSGQLCQVSEKFREVLDTPVHHPLCAPVSSLAR